MPIYIIIMISRRRVAPVIGRGLGTVCCWTTAARGSSSSTWSGQASEDRRRLRCRAVQRPRPFCPPADVSHAGFRRYSPQSSARVSACWRSSWAVVCGPTSSSSRRRPNRVYPWRPIDYNIWKLNYYYYDIAVVSIAATVIT